MRIAPEEECAGHGGREPAGDHAQAATREEQIGQRPADRAQGFGVLLHMPHLQVIQRRVEESFGLEGRFAAPQEQLAQGRAGQGFVARADAAQVAPIGAVDVGQAGRRDDDQDSRAIQGRQFGDGHDQGRIGLQGQVHDALTRRRRIGQAGRRAEDEDAAGGVGEGDQGFLDTPGGRFFGEQLQVGTRAGVQQGT